MIWFILQEYGKSKNCRENDPQQLKPNEAVDGNSVLPVTQLTTYLNKGYESLRNFDHAMYSPDTKDQALIMQTGSRSRVQYNALRQPQRPVGAINPHEPTTIKTMPLLGGRFHEQSVIENSAELSSFIGIFPLSGITYKLNSRDIKQQKPRKQPLSVLESELGPQFNLQPMMCNSTKSSTGNRNNARINTDHNSTNSLKGGGEASKVKGDDEAQVENKLFHVKIRTSKDDAALDKLSRYHRCSAQTVRCTHTREQLRTNLHVHRPATSTLTRSTLHKNSASVQASRNNAEVHRKVTESQEIDYRQPDESNNGGTQLERTATNSEKRLTGSVFPASSAAVGVSRSRQSVVSIAPPLLTSSPAVVNTLAAPSVTLFQSHLPIKSALILNNSALSSARLVSGEADKIRDRSARGRKGKLENENATWLRAVKHSKSPNQRRKTKPVTASATRRFGSAGGRQSTFAKGRSSSSIEGELTSETNKVLVCGSSDGILRQTLLEKREAMNAAENSEEEIQERNERIFEWLIGLNYSDQEAPPSPVIIEETPMQTDTAIHIVYNGD